MLGKVTETTCRLNIYVHRPDSPSRAYSAEAWGYGQITGRKCLVIREVGSQLNIVLGCITHRSNIPKEDVALMMRVQVVEEGLSPSDRAEWHFLIDDVDEFTRSKVLEGPLIEPGPLVGEQLHL